MSKNILEPKTINIDGDNITLYTARFNGLYDLYDYLKSDPKINPKAFNEDYLSSIYFDGNISYEEALENLKSKDFSEESLLRLKEKLPIVNRRVASKYILERSVSGGTINIPAFCQGDPYCYEIEERVKSPNYIKLFISLNYGSKTTTSQIDNRAIIIASLVDYLERANYHVELNCFALSYCYSEVMKILINIKKPTEKTNMNDFCKMFNEEFLRRLLFRVQETMDFQEAWSENGYGWLVGPESTKKILDIDSKEVLIGSPKDLGIKGNDLIEDYISTLNNINLTGTINSERLKEELSLRRKM